MSIKNIKSVQRYEYDYGQKAMRSLFLILPLSILLSSCWDFTFNRPSPPIDPPIKVLGYKPVFTVDSSILKIAVTTPQPVKNPGKIYVKGNLIFQNDLGSGIHVIDNTVPSAAANIGFIKILGNSEISIKEDILYANSFTDLVVVDISDWQHVKELKRMKGAFSQGAQAGSYPAYNFIPLPERGVYYECFGYNPTHVLTGWVKDSVFNNNCFYP